MNLKLTPEAAQSFVNLRASPDFTVVLKWIADHRKRFRDECCTGLDFPKITRSQGRAEAVDGILNAAAEAPKLLQKLRSQQ